MTIEILLLLFHCFYHQFTLTAFCFIIVFHYALCAANHTLNLNGMEVLKVQLSVET
jgi:hypothetical protein